MTTSVHFIEVKSLASLCCLNFLTFLLNRPVIKRPWVRFPVPDSYFSKNYICGFVKAENEHKGSLR